MDMGAAAEWAGVVICVLAYTVAMGVWVLNRIDTKASQLDLDAHKALVERQNAAIWQEMRETRNNLSTKIDELGKALNSRLDTILIALRAKDD